MRAQRPDCRAFSEVERFGLYGRLIGDKGHNAAERGYLEYYLRFGEAAYGGIARHLRYVIYIDGNAERFNAHLRKRVKRFAAGVSESYYNDVVFTQIHNQRPFFFLESR